jgi:hypothetical protein
VDDFWLIRQYIQPTALRSQDDGIGALRE